MKKTFHALGALTIAAALTLFTTACTNDDNFVNDEPQTEQPAAVKTYQVNIPATIGNDATTRAVSFDGTTSNSTFESSEKVYVYNATTDEVMGGYLQPSDISADGKHCNLTGTLTGGTISETNNLKLIYNPTIVVTDKTDNNHKKHTYFNYNTQDGTQAGVIDGAEADVTVSSYTGGVLTTTATASFQNVQSMFRFKFEDGSSNAISVKVLQITTSSFGIHSNYYPIRTGALFSETGIMLNLPTATSDYIYFGMAVDENYTSDVLTFTVTDGSGNVYQGTKSAPTGGFKNGKYYYNSSAITLTKQNYVTPDITWTNPSTPITPDEYYQYKIPSTVSNSDITISGTSKGYCFRLEQNGTVRLNNLNATYDGNDYNFIECIGSLTLEVNGTNTINCNNFHVAVFVNSSGTLKLTGNGTLTVHVNGSGDTKCGLQCNGNYSSANSTNDYNNTGVVDVTTQLALDPAKTTVTRGARSGDKTNGYTWTYTVTTNN